MSKIIRLKKSVFDQRHPDLTIEQTVNNSSKRLTEVLFAENHPLYQILRLSFDEDSIRARRIRFDVCGVALFTKHPTSGNQLVVFNVKSLSLQVVMMDARAKQTPETDALTVRMQKIIEEFLNSEGFSLPCETPEEMERFLEYLAQDIPELWNYFRVINKAS